MPLPYISASGQHATLACRGQRDTPGFPRASSLAWHRKRGWETIPELNDGKEGG
jgi:hypothetical protein